ncbi:ABC transporter permease subunit [Treponema maltophilum]|uniref:ABC transporter permease subunit n=1 Tax=Treponema maltophilum TaxID=51160 RepID=UPI003D8CB0D2
MNTKAVIVKRELGAYFTGAVGYIVIGLFLLISGFLFFNVFFLENRAELRRFFSTLPVLLAFFIPAVTMRLFAEERKSGSLETLMTLPVSSVDVVMGKFWASLAFTSVMIAPTLVYALTASLFGSLDAAPVVCGYLGAVFLAAAFCSVGLFASASTKNQIVAFFIGWALCILLALIDQFLLFLPARLANFLGYLSAGSHFTSVSRGIVDSRDLVYFVSLTAVFLTLTVKTIDSRRAA